MSLALATLVAVVASQAGPPVRAEALALAEQVRPGESLTLAVRLEIAPEWRVFWTNPGDSQVPTTVEWSAPPQLRVEPLAGPAPRRFSSSNGVQFGFERESILVARVHAPAHTALGQYPVQARVAWMACKGEDCIPGSATLAFPVAVGQQARAAPAAARRIAEAMARLPRPSPWRVEGDVSDRGIALRILPGEPAWAMRGTPTFLPFDPDLIDHAAPQSMRVDPDGSRVLLMRRGRNLVDLPDRIGGLLLAPSGERWPGGLESLLIDAPVESGDDAATERSAFGAYSVY